jgi:hypothetical protein
MPVIAVAQPDGRATLTYEDPYTFDEWARAMQVLLDVGRPLRVLVDRRQGSPLRREFVERMVQFFQRHATDIQGWRVAVVISGEAGYGMARMLELTAEARNVSFALRSFRSYEPAEAWLHAEQ